MRRNIFLSMVVLALGGCALHPLPGDVTGFNTIDITNHIRCEARDAIQRKAIDLLEDYNSASSIDLAAKLKADPALFKTFKREYLQDKTQKDFYDRYINTAIAYDFTFDMAETNNASTQVDLVKAVSGGAFSLALNASNERSRQNIRKFQIVETFGDVLRSKNIECDRISSAQNFVYPITGNVGIGEIINTFIDLNETKTLKPKEAKGPAMADQLQFNTAFSGSVAPKIVLSSITAPTGNRFRLADASLNNSVSRTDRHQLIIGLSIPPTEKTKNESGGGILGLGFVGKSVLSSRNVTPAGQRATEAITQFRLDLFLDRAGPTILR